MPPSWPTLIALLTLLALRDADARAHPIKSNVSRVCADLTSTPASACKCGSTSRTKYEVSCGPLTVKYEADAKQLEVQCNPQLLTAVPLLEDYVAAASKASAAAAIGNIAAVRVPPARRLDVFLCDVSESTRPLQELIVQTGAEVLSLRSMALPAAGRLQLDYADAQLRAVLGNVTALQMKDDGLAELPYELLARMPALTVASFERNALQRLRQPLSGAAGLVELNLAENRIAVVDPSALRGLAALKVLYLYSNAISELDATVFGDLAQLESLELMRNNLRAVDAPLLANLTRLRAINLSINQLRALPEELFWRSPLLTLVRLESNQLAALPAGIFARSANLVHVSLQKNQLAGLHTATFGGLSKLKTLDLAHNRLTALEGGWFDALRALETLRLAGNQIASVEADAFQRLGALRELDLSGNRLTHLPLTTFAEQARLVELRLAGNRIAVEHSDTSFLNYLVSVELVELARNRLDYIPADFMATKSNLRELDLDGNLLTTFDFVDLHNAISNVSLTLTNNRIASVANMALVEALDRGAAAFYKRLNLAGNPLRCDAWNYDLWRYFNLEMPAFRSVYDIGEQAGMVCGAPPELAGRPFYDERAKVDPCRLLYVMEVCPGNCSCYHVPAANSVTVDCARRGLRSVPALFVPEGGNYTAIREMCRVGGGGAAPVVRVVLRENRIAALPPASFANINVTVLDVSFNNLSELAWLPRGLESLTLDHNALRRINKTLLEELRDVTLNDNPWLCDCETVPLWLFLGEHEHIPNKMEVRCADTRKSIRGLTRESLCPTYTKLIVAIGAATMLLILLPAVALVLFYKHKQAVKVWLFAHNRCLWLVREEDVDRDKKYDAFVSFSQRDEAFVLQHLLPQLEDVPEPYRLCVHMRNWVPGEFIAKQVADSVLASRRTIVVLSPAFLESVWGKMEFRAAHTKALSEGIARVIIVLYGDLDPSDARLDAELRMYLKTNTYVRWGDPWFWEKLRYALPHRKRAAASRRFESVSASLDKMAKMDTINQNVSVINGGGAHTPPADPLLLKARA